MSSANNLNTQNNKAIRIDITDYTAEELLNEISNIQSEFDRHMEGVYRMLEMLTGKDDIRHSIDLEQMIQFVIETNGDSSGNSANLSEYFEGNYLTLEGQLLLDERTDEISRENFESAVGWINNQLTGGGRSNTENEIINQMIGMLNPDLGNAFGVTDNILSGARIVRDIYDISQGGGREAVKNLGGHIFEFGLPLIGKALFGDIGALGASFATDLWKDDFSETFARVYYDVQSFEMPIEEIHEMSAQLSDYELQEWFAARMYTDVMGADEKQTAQIDASALSRNKSEFTLQEEYLQSDEYRTQVEEFFRSLKVEVPETATGMPVLNEFIESVNKLKGLDVLEIEINDENEIKLNIEEDVLSGMGLDDSEITELVEQLHAVAEFISDFNKDGRHEILKSKIGDDDTYEMELDWERFGYAKDSFRKGFFDEYAGIQEIWQSMPAWFDESVWGPIASGAGLTNTEIQNIETRLNGLDGRIVHVSVITTTSEGSPILACANGGILTGPQIALVGEAGPESVIPLSQARRDRGIELWQETGEILGVLPTSPSSANNVIPFPAVSSRSEVASESWYSEESDGESDIWAGLSVSPAVPVSTGMQQGESGMSIQVSVTSNPDYVIQAADGMDAEAVMGLIRSRSRELAKDLADDIGGELAGRLEMVYDNIPLKGVS